MNIQKYKKLLLCPKCHGDLEIGDKIMCSRCRSSYNIIDDLPVMIPGPDEKVKQRILEVKSQKKGMFNRSRFGIPYYKLDYLMKKHLFNFFGIKLPKLKDQRDYWLLRGNEYYHEFSTSGYQNFEIFFQNIVINELKKLEFNSIFEAGCGFGWNIKRFKQEFPKAKVGGLDFSHTQLFNAKNNYIKNDEIILTEGDITRMPFQDNAFDVGFSLGVFMNINKSKIDRAIDEMIRVCKKYIVHMEYDEARTTKELRKSRAFKTNIISHDYKKLYEERGLKVVKMLTYIDFQKEYAGFFKEKVAVDRWEQIEGCAKYMLLIVENT
jgi:ubiquinone/menaquinone biosynthesis C-methylase UbiE/uncharacterized protein YbaR (Trm112 family)